MYSSRLGAGDQKQSDTIAELIKVIDQADLLNSDGEILGDAYEYLIGQFASETGKKAGEFYTPQAVSKILTRIAITGQENVKGLSIYEIKTIGLIQRHDTHRQQNMLKTA